jgi:hypothetical protein
MSLGKPDLSPKNKKIPLPIKIEKDIKKQTGIKN